MANPFRIMFWDIETSPNIVTSWRVGYKLQISYDNIIKERSIICICWKWEDEEKVYYLTWDKEQNDKAMLEKFVKEMAKADIIIGHNSDKFDETWVRTRCIFHRIPALPKYKSLDTLKIARKGFNFNSNRLNYIGQYLGLGEKIKTEFDLWKRIVLQNDKKALKYMVEYCQQDVNLLEQVYKELQKYAEPVTHKAVALGGEKWDCPHCASENVRIHTTKYSRVGTATTQMVCKDCSRYYNVSESVRRQYAEHKLKEARKKFNL
jgi:DNA polymerase elongation subunit (family B)